MPPQKLWPRSGPRTQRYQKPTLWCRFLTASNRQSKPD